MISALEWVPAGVADPKPKKYEFSPAELELIQMMENQNLVEEGQAEANAPSSPELSTTPKTPASSPENVPPPSSNKNSNASNSLPADLRMDEYSSDEDDDADDGGAKKGTLLGRLLVEGGDMAGEEEEEAYDEMEAEAEADDKKGSGDGSDSDDGESDDENGDEDDDDGGDDREMMMMEDDREYMPIDIDGLKAMGLTKIGSSAAPSYMNDLENGLDGEEDDDDDSDAEDVQIRPIDDAVLVIAKTEDEFAALEVHVYEQDTGNLYVHHDIPLPAFPLCVAHGDISPSGTAGNYCAVGTFGTGIEIWNLDVLNALEPSCVLGGEDTSMADEIMRHNMMKNGRQHGNNAGVGGFRKPHGSGGLKHGSHTDAIMSLSWNKVHRQVIASGSADNTVKLWDVTQAHNPVQAIAGTLTHHKDKVQSVLWHPVEGTLLATGSYDRTVCLVDARQPNENVKRAKLSADCEALAWDPHHPEYLTASTEDGTVTCFDVRKFSDKKPLWSIVASEYGGVSDISYNPYVPGLLATCSVDKTVTLWDTHNASTGNPAGPPTSRMNKDMRVGKLYTVNFYPSSPWLLGCAGGAKEMALWDMTRDDVVQKCFAKRLIEKTPAVVGDQTTEQSQTNDFIAAEKDKKEAFDAMMTASSENSNGASKTDEKSSIKKKKKDKGKSKKKKAHRAGR
mmetsp:Transcript_53374/g.129832  ORF Transcript_53374/g.129832 Transcript_53374/m.129832 type:complete len:677 (-) Transcript_53374:112-2142(-)